MAAAMEEVETRKENWEFLELEEELSRGTEPALPVLYLPVNNLTKRSVSCETFYKGCAAAQEYFLRDEKFVYVEEDQKRGTILWELTPGDLTSKIEAIFELRKKSVNKETQEIVERGVNLELPEAVLLLATKSEMRKYSLPLRLLSASPVLVAREGEPVILDRRGYHPDEDGIYITGHLPIPGLSIKEAKDLLLDLFRDYDFTRPSDRSRAIAFLLSLALKLGNLLGDSDFPLLVMIGNESQSGKGHLFKLIQAVYGESAWTITQTRGGVGGSLDEAVATALLSGKPFIIIDDVRGDLDSQLLESILRGTGRVAARVPYQRAILTQTNRSIWGLTSNGVVVPKDLTNRSLIVSHRKQPPDYKHQSSLGWGDEVFVELARRRAEYLGAVFAVIAEWIRRGRPRTDERRHSFRDWVQAADYIVREILGLAPLLDDHEAAQHVLNDPVMGWLREVMKEVEKTNPGLDVTLKAADIGDLCKERGIELPNHKGPFRTGPFGNDDRNQHIGRLLGNLYRDRLDRNLNNPNELKIERIGLRRTQTPNDHGNTTNSYLFYYPDPPATGTR
jgi:hypothetical protein